MQVRPKWWREVTPYQWLVFAVVSLAWGFDSLDQRVFSLARISALSSLMHATGSALSVQAFAKIATAVFLFGWGLGGLTFGAMGDRLGRARILGLCIILYALCTGVTALTRSALVFAILRFLTGVGIGGVYGLAVATLAEVVSGRARVAMLAWLQVISLLANCAAAFLKLGIDALASQGFIEPAEDWRWLFAIGALPALIGVFACFKMKDSESWLQMKAAGALPTSVFDAYRRLFVAKTERRALLVGCALSIAGVVGLWSIGEYAVDLLDAVFTRYFTNAYSLAAAPELVSRAKNWAYILQMLGGAAGMLIFTVLADRLGRRPAFLVGFFAAFVVTILVFWRLNSPMDAYWMMPLLGAAQLSVFAGFSIYLPELFGTAVRGTGISFAYNCGRFAAAGGGFGSALLTTHVFGGFGDLWPLRLSAIAMCSIFVIGLIAAAYAPETRGQPLRD